MSFLFIFIYRNEIYEQLDGMTTESTLAPVLANVFMERFQKKTLETRVLKTKKIVPVRRRRVCNVATQ